MTENEQLADGIALVIHAETAPLLAKISALEARPLARDGEKGLDGKSGVDGKDGRDGEKGLDGKSGLDGKDGRDGEKGLDGKSGLDGKDGRDGEKGLDGKPGDLGPEGPMGPQGVPGRDGRDGIGLPGPAGAKGADGLVVETVPGLSPEVVSASVDMLLRKELAALDAATPPRMTKRIIRDARGKIERVIEEPTRA